MNVRRLQIQLIFEHWAALPPKVDVDRLCEGFKKAALPLPSRKTQRHFHPPMARFKGVSSPPG
jgi:hypothetical protein